MDDVVSFPALVVALGITFVVDIGFTPGDIYLAVFRGQQLSDSDE